MVLPTVPQVPGLAGNLAGRGRDVAHVVQTVLLAGGAPTSQEKERANVALARLGCPMLDEHDSCVTTPEELAAIVPVEARPPLAALLFELAGTEPMRRRLAHTYATLWGVTPPAAAPVQPDRTNGTKTSATAKVARWIVGALPRHHETGVPEGASMATSYRQTNEAPVTVQAVRDPLRDKAERIQREFRAVVDAVDRVLIGKRSVVEKALTAMTARGHVLLVDAPGVGKTLLCKAVAAACGVRFGRIQFTPDLLPMDLTGAPVYDAGSRSFVFRQGPVFTELLLADEINRATPKTQSALLEVMEERTVTVDSTSYRMAEPFLVLATMNPIEHEGTFPLPAAQIDRFMVMLELGQLTPEDEVKVLDRHLSPQPALETIAPVLTAHAFVEWQRTAPLVHVSPEVKRAAVDYVNRLRQGEGGAQAVSPRATLAWMRASQAHALLSGREFVTAEDLLETSGDVLRHRLWLTPAEVRGRLAAAAGRGAA